MMALSRPFQERIDHPTHCQKKDKKEWKSFLFIGPTDSGRPEDRYRVEFYFIKRDNKQELYYDTNMSGPDLGLLESTVELAEKRDVTEWQNITSKELDFFLRETNSKEIGPKNLLNFEDPLKAISAFAKIILHANAEDSSFQLSSNGRFIDLSLEERVDWAQKAINTFLNKENIKKDAIELLAIDKLLVILRVRNVDNLEKLLDDIQVYLSKYFNEPELNVIAD